MCGIATYWYKNHEEPKEKKQKITFMSPTVQTSIGHNPVWSKQEKSLKTTKTNRGFPFNAKSNLTEATFVQNIDFFFHICRIIYMPDITQYLTCLLTLGHLYCSSPHLQTRPYLQKWSLFCPNQNMTGCCFRRCSGKVSLMVRLLSTLIGPYGVRKNSDI